MQKNVIEYLKSTVVKYPEKTAVRDSERSITFAELWSNAKKIATKVCQSVNKQSSPVGIYIPKGCYMIEAYAGISMSGNFYIPLDTKSPNSRIESIVGTLEAQCIITDRNHEKQLRNFFNGDVIIIEETFEVEHDESLLHNAWIKQIDTDPVYSIFTSGSTGTPKGVVVSHKSVIDYVDWLNTTFNITSETIIGNQAPFYFDNSVLDIYLMYSTGATLDIIPEMLFSFPSELITFLNVHHISLIFWVPSALVNVANSDVLKTQKAEFLKDVFFCGEVMPTPHLMEWKRNLPHCRYVNMYGPTEITDVCTYYVIDRDFNDNDPLPIGIPCLNTDIMILVDRQRLAEGSEKGEICVRGTCLAKGYYNNEQKTSDAFIQNPLNPHYPETIYCTGDVGYINERGEIMCLGRMDAQIKHNGYRIELGEIEAAALSTQIVDCVCVVYNSESKKIIMFYQGESDIKLPFFIRAIGAKIPRYMVPTEYHRVDSMRTNANGKIDRAYYNSIIKTL